MCVEMQCCLCRDSVEQKPAMNWKVPPNRTEYQLIGTKCLIGSELVVGIWYNSV